MKKLMSFTAAAAFALLLSGCADNQPPSTQVPRLTFDNVRPIMVDVAKIEIIDSAKTASGGQHVELMMKQPPETAVQELLKKQLVAGGPHGLMRVYVDNASVTGEKLEVTKGMAGMFTNEPAERYHAIIDLRFEVSSDDAPDIVTRHANVHAERTQTVMKDASPVDRDMAFFHLDDQLMADVSSELQTQVKTTFGLH